MCSGEISWNFFLLYIFCESNIWMKHYSPIEINGVMGWGRSGGDRLRRCEKWFRLAVVLYGSKIESDFFLQLGFAETETEIVAGKETSSVVGTAEGECLIGLWEEQRRKRIHVDYSNSITQKHYYQLIELKQKLNWIQFNVRTKTTKTLSTEYM